MSMKTKIAIVLVLAVSLWMAGCSDGMDVAEFPDLEGGLTEMDDNSNEDAGIVDGEADEDAQADAAAESDSDESKETDSGVEEELEGPVGKGVGDFNITNPPKLIRDDDDASVAMEAKKYPAPIIVNPHPASFKVVGGVDIEVPQKRAHKVRVTYWTGDRKKGGTDEFVGIKFCKEEGLLSESSMDTPTGKR